MVTKDCARNVMKKYARNVQNALKIYTFNIEWNPNLSISVLAASPQNIIISEQLFWGRYNFFG